MELSPAAPSSAQRTKRERSIGRWKRYRSSSSEPPPHTQTNRRRLDFTTPSTATSKRLHREQADTSSQRTDRKRSYLISSSESPPLRSAGAQRLRMSRRREQCAGEESTPQTPGQADMGRSQRDPDAPETPPESREGQSSIYTLTTATAHTIESLTSKYIASQ